uniref:ribonuclease H n=1 Tax=Diabrotica virgifera virgifera TaxID=50390 RepID=A0A6P7GCL1_DIAVI
MFKADIKELSSNAYQIYTDASKSTKGTACAIYDPQTNESKMFKLNANSSIYSAELIGILEALNYGQHLPNKKIYIFSDSKSALQKIKHLQSTSKINYIILEILQKVEELNKDFKTIHLIWVKSHCGILGNETVDVLAKRAIHEGEGTKYKCTTNEIKKVINNVWKSKWEEDNKNNQKGKHYKEIQETIPKKPWFIKGNLSKNAIRKICRLRFNHVPVPKFLFKIRLKTDPYCNCGEIGDAEHQILNCSLIQAQVKIFLDKIYKLKDV